MMKKLKKSNLESEKARKREEEKGRRGERQTFPFYQSLLLFLIGAFALLNLACQPNQTILKDAAPPPTPLATVESKKTTLEEDLKEMQTADFDYIFVFRRKDGGVFDKDDQKYLRDNTPLETNRWRKSDDGKAFIAGSGFSFLPEQWTALRSRFIVEDYSKPEVKEAANNANYTVNVEINKPAANSNKQANK